MKIKLILLTVLITFSFMKPNAPSDIIFDFKTSTDIGSWKIVNDGVMGGSSNSTFSQNKEGHGVFKGNVSIENNGGFASVRLQLSSFIVNDSKQLKIKLKGDGKNYQLRVKANASDYYSYITEFSTSGSWETIVINLNNLYPSFRGRKMDQENFNAPSFEEISFLIANKKSEPFILELEKIELD